jgi:hypothetical protein
MKKSANMLEVKRFLEGDDGPMPLGEWREFWESLTEEEKELFKQQVGQLI